MSKQLAIVTGGSTGIGQHLVQALAEAGYAVAFNYRSDATSAEANAAKLKADGHQALVLRCDVGNKAQVDDFHAKVADWHGAAPALLVNNAGIQTWSSLLDLSEERWDAVIDTNLKGTFLNTQAAARTMKDAGGGSIINLGSGCNKLAFPNLVDYTASKGGIEQLTKSSAVELGKYGIRVNCVAPGAIWTERTVDEGPDYEKGWTSITPLGRVGQVDDVSDVILFFASDASRFVTGQTLWVDGGVFSRANWPYPV